MSVRDIRIHWHDATKCESTYWPHPAGIQLFLYSNHSEQCCILLLQNTTRATKRCFHIISRLHMLNTFRWRLSYQRILATESLGHVDVHERKGLLKNQVRVANKPIWSGRADAGIKSYNPAETNPCNVMIPSTTLLSSTTGKNCTGEGGDSIFAMASTAIASAVIVLGFLKDTEHSVLLLSTFTQNIWNQDWAFHCQIICGVMQIQKVKKQQI
jgi:hypothetical protein